MPRRLNGSPLPIKTWYVIYRRDDLLQGGPTFHFATNAWTYYESLDDPTAYVIEQRTDDGVTTRLA